MRSEQVGPLRTYPAGDRAKAPHSIYDKTCRCARTDTRNRNIHHNPYLS